VFLLSRGTQMMPQNKNIRSQSRHQQNPRTSLTATCCPILLPAD
jgi:hypothetical protein